MRFPGGFYALKIKGAAPLDNPPGMTVFFSVLMGSSELDGACMLVFDPGAQNGIFARSIFIDKLMTLPNGIELEILDIMPEIARRHFGFIGRDKGATVRNKDIKGAGAFICAQVESDCIKVAYHCEMPRGNGARYGAGLARIPRHDRAIHWNQMACDGPGKAYITGEYLDGFKRAVIDAVNDLL